MVAIKFPKNPNIYLIIMGAVLIFFSFSIIEKGILAYMFMILGAISFFLGLIGLEKTQGLKDKKTEEEIKLLQIQQDKIKKEINKTHVIRM